MPDILPVIVAATAIVAAEIDTGQVGLDILLDGAIIVAIQPPVAGNWALAAWTGWRLCAATEKGMAKAATASVQAKSVRASFDVIKGFIEISP